MRKKKKAQAKRSVSKTSKRKKIGRPPVVHLEDPDAKFMTLAQYARHSNSIYQTVMGWRSRGWLVETQDGLIDVVASDARLVEMRTKVVAGKDDGGVKDAPFTERGAKQVRESYIALKRKLEFELEAKQVARIADIEQAIAIEYATVRSKLLSIPTSCAPHCVGKTAVEIADMMGRYINAALESLTADEGDVVDKIENGNEHSGDDTDVE